MKPVILRPLTGVFAAALLGGCAASPYDTSMNSCDQEYMMTNPAGADYYCGPGYEYPLYDGGFLGFVDIDRFHHHDHDFDFHGGHDHDHDFHHGGAMAGRGHGEAHAEGHGGGHDSSGFGSDFQPSGESGSHGGGPHK